MRFLTEKSPIKSKISAKDGFTLIELLIAIAIFIIFSFVITSFQKNIFSSESYLETGLQAEDDAVIILRNLIAEIRAMNFSAEGAYPIALASSYSFSFYCDINNDGKTEALRYFLDGTMLKKGIKYPIGSPLSYSNATETVAVVARNVIPGSPIFSYYDTDYDGTNAPLEVPINIPAIRLVKVNIPIDLDTGDGMTAYSITSQVSIRNLKENL